MHTVCHAATNLMFWSCMVLSSSSPWKLSVSRSRFGLRRHLCNWGADIDVAWTVNALYWRPFTIWTIMQLLGMWLSFHTESQFIDLVGAVTISMKRYHGMNIIYPPLHALNHSAYWKSNQWVSSRTLWCRNEIEITNNNYYWVEMIISIVIIIIIAVILLSSIYYTQIPVSNVCHVVSRWKTGQVSLPTVFLVRVNSLLMALWSTPCVWALILFLLVQMKIPI